MYFYFFSTHSSLDLMRDLWLREKASRVFSRQLTTTTSTPFLPTRNDCSFGAIENSNVISQPTVWHFETKKEETREGRQNFNCTRKRWYQGLLTWNVVFAGAVILIIRSIEMSVIMNAARFSLVDKFEPRCRIWSDVNDDSLFLTMRLFLPIRANQSVILLEFLLAEKN